MKKSPLHGDPFTVIVFRLFCYGIYAYLLAEPVVTLETHNTVNLCIKRVVLADAYVETRMEMCAALSYKYITCYNELTVCTLRS